MAIVFMDSFDHCATADLPYKWDQVDSATYCTIQSGGRTGTCYRAATNNGIIYKWVPSQTTYIIGFAVKFSSFPIDTYSFLAFGNSQGWEDVLLVNSDGTLQAGRVNSGNFVLGSKTVYWTTLGSASASALSANQWYYLEVKLTVDNSAGVFKVNVNGSNTGWLNLTSQDTLRNAASITKIGIGTIGASASIYTYLDDLYIADTTGSAPQNDMLGDVTVECVLPSTGQGTTNDWDCSTGADHGALVDEATPNTTDYVTGDAANEVELFNYPALAANASSTVHAVQNNLLMQAQSAGARTVVSASRVNGTTRAASTNHIPGASYYYYPTVYNVSPDTSSAWTVTEINASEFGAKVTV